MPSRSTTPRAEPAAPETVQSLRKGFEILRCFEPNHDVLGNKELSERTGMPRPTVARFTATLVELGYLRTTPDRKYRLTSAVLDLGFTFLANYEIRELIRPYLQEVADFAMAGCSVGTIDDLNMLYIEQCRCRAIRMGVHVTVGARVPITTTAMGHAYLAGLLPDELAHTLRLLRLAWPREWSKNRRAIEASIAQVRETGFCAVLGGWQEGIHAVGVPLVSRDGQHVYGVTCAGPSNLLPKEKIIGKVGPKLVEMVRSASTMIL
ncbi:IclR family transcriptional regulator [Variovorax sp. Sphag1AA]|uniref:IclR family transcriptional regulator n=1 Tax=Variovorax sp. Sphag1AA TaxID=2587027 RepID=UPI00160BBA1E|nr:IclR family transcriptional regulator [Variovorax sp. Sphag1AA]MBB3178730.1 DNA-binding IclR family transcriptional regulator [Variovorax sp. Sphag1AA]